MKKASKSFSLVLLVSFLAMVIPQILGYLGAQVLVYSICYSVSILSLLIYYFKYKTGIKRSGPVFLLLYIITLLLPLIFNSFTGICTVDNDYIDTAIKIISTVFLFMLVPKQMKIKEYKLLFYGVSIFVVIACLFNIFINIGDMLSITSLDNSYMVSFASFFANRNTFAMYLFVGILVANLLIRLDPARKKLLVTIITLEFVNLLFTMSRGGLLAAVIVLFPSLFEAGKKHVKLVAFVVLTGLFILASNPNISSTFSRLVIRSDVGVSGRSELWNEGIEYSRNTNMITGTGYYTALNTIGVNQLHSMYIDTLIDTGIIGIAIKIGFFLSSLLCIKRLKDENNTKWVYLRAYLAVLLLGIFESVNIFALGSTEMLYTIFFITIPQTLSDGGSHD